MIINRSQHENLGWSVIFLSTMWNLFALKIEQVDLRQNQKEDYYSTSEKE